MLSTSLALFASRTQSTLWTFLVLTRPWTRPKLSPHKIACRLLRLGPADDAVNAALSVKLLLLDT
eukprot:6174378-Pleurochrysis_carterae.AAC.1